MGAMLSGLLLNGFCNLLLTYRIGGRKQKTEIAKKGNVHFNLKAVRGKHRQGHIVWMAYLEWLGACGRRQPQSVSDEQNANK